MASLQGRLRLPQSSTTPILDVISYRRIRVIIQLPASAAVLNCCVFRCRWKLFRDEVLQRPDGREVLFNGRPPLQEGWVSEQVRRSALRCCHC